MCAAIKKPSTGRVFEFFTVFMYVKKTNFILQCDACAVSFRWSYLMLVCVCNIFTSTADLWLPRYSLTADGTSLCTDKLEEDEHSRLLWPFDIVLGRSRSLSLSHQHSILEGQSALCSIASFYDIVHGLHCCNSTARLVKGSLFLSSTEG